MEELEYQRRSRGVKEGGGGGGRYLDKGFYEEILCDGTHSITTRLRLRVTNPQVWPINDRQTK